MAEIVLSLASNTDSNYGPEPSKRKQPKSRNGCITCKTRRMKCDELKPTCQQCLRRGVICGGYPKVLRWRPIFSNDPPGGEAPRGFHPSLKSLSARSHQRPFHGSASIALGSVAESLEQTDLDPMDCSKAATTTTFPGYALPSHQETGSSATPPDSQDALAEAENPATTIQQSSLSSLIDSVFANSPQSIDFGSFLLTPGVDGALYQSSPLNDLLSNTDVDYRGQWDMQREEEFVESCGQVEEDDENTTVPMEESQMDPEPATHRRPSRPANPGNDHDQTTTLQSSLSTNPEMIRLLFEAQTCEILSIKEDQSKNPWRTLIWPLATEYPALYHAVAAMSCLHLCKLQPQLRAAGLNHFEISQRSLVDHKDKMSVHATIATRLGLAFAQIWDQDTTMTGIEHITAARILIREAGSKDQLSKMAPFDLSRLSFLANTCLYMDVISRLTCVDSQCAQDAEFIAVCTTLSSFVPDEQQLDPLMGCAITLFPLIGQLAELVGRVRQRTERRNSPAIISKATDLRVAMEGWMPPINSENTVDLTHNLTDSIQTAEAYRWAALLLLRQAVPEVPWRHSFLQISSRSLVYLATIPLTSRTTIVQVMPLMLTGCEAYEDDDRVWVDERWELMSKRMVTGIVEKCRDITTETWRRRDEYETKIGLREAARQRSSPAETRDLRKTTSSSDNGVQEHVEEASGSGSTTRASTEPLDFPESAAFKKGIDPVTRAGHMHYTVKGEMHWFNVMNDLDCQVFLG